MVDVWYADRILNPDEVTPEIEKDCVKLVALYDYEHLQKQLDECRNAGAELVRVDQIKQGEIRKLRSELDEQCRINGIGQERELKLMAEIERLKKRLLGFENSPPNTDQN